MRGGRLQVDLHSMIESVVCWINRDPVRCRRCFILTTAAAPKGSPWRLWALQAGHGMVSRAVYRSYYHGTCIPTCIQQRCTPQSVMCAVGIRCGDVGETCRTIPCPKKQENSLVKVQASMLKSHLQGDGSCPGLPCLHTIGLYNQHFAQ